MLNFNEFLNELNIQPASNIIVHASFKKIYSSFLNIAPENVIKALKEKVTESGSIIFPTFTYCFKKSVGPFESYDKVKSKSKVGLLSEIFRLSQGVIRTSSSTHSFALWGRITKDIDENNSPESPLGKGSVMEWLTDHKNSFNLLLGTDFSSLTYGHYLEIEAKVPWYDFSPWEHLNVLPSGVSINGRQLLKEIPGCSKSFVNFEMYLLKENIISKNFYNGLETYLINVNDLYSNGLKFFKTNYVSLLCNKGTCPACDSRRKKYLQV